MVYISVKVSGLKEAQQKMKLIESRMPTIREKIMDTMAKRTIQHMKRKIQRNYWSGITYETLRVDTTRRGNKQIVTDAPYFVFQETGFRRHLVGADTPTGSGRKFGDWIREKYMPRHPREKMPKALYVEKPRSKSHIAVPALMKTQEEFPEIVDRIFRENIK